MSQIRDVRYFELVEDVPGGTTVTLRLVDRIGAPDPTLRSGSSGDAVRRLEQALAFLGHLEPSRVDGTWDEQTAAALEAFQRSAGLKDDAIYGPKSHDALEIALGATGEVSPPPSDPAPPPTEPASPSPSPSTGCTHCDLLQRLVDEGTVEAKCRRSSSDREAAAALQHHLARFGYDLGTSGPAGDGVDGGYGKRTADALAAFVAEAGGAGDPDPDKLSARDAALVIEQCAAGFRTTAPPTAAPSPAPADGAPESWASRLSARPTEAENQFKRRVYALHIARSRAAGKTFNPSLPSSQVATVEGRYTLRHDAAEQARRMLAAARAVSGARPVGVCSAYRSADDQFRIWDRNYEAYFNQTASSRAAASGGPLGDAAARVLRDHYASSVAAPGFSNHQDGLAIDLTTEEGGVSYGASKKQAAGWRRTWFYGWLTQNAGTYGFKENKSINEPWHWEFRA